MTAERDAKGHLLPGHSLGGRPVGTSQIARIKALIEPRREAVIANLLKIAEGDGKDAVRAGDVVLSFLAGRPKPQSELINIPAMAEATTYEDKTRAVLDALATGQVSAEAARAVIQTIDAAVRIRGFPELDARLKVLEGRAPRVIEAASSPADGSDLL